jgi:hypothetical protein
LSKRVSIVLAYNPKNKISMKSPYRAGNGDASLSFQLLRRQRWVGMKFEDRMGKKVASPHLNKQARMWWYMTIIPPRRQAQVG